MAAYTGLITRLLLFAATFVVLFWMVMDVTASRTPHPAAKGYYRYETITGFFKQDDPSTDPRTFNYVCTFFRPVI